MRSPSLGKHEQASADAYLWCFGRERQSTSEKYREPTALPKRKLTQPVDAGYNAVAGAPIGCCRRGEVDRQGGDKVKAYNQPRSPSATWQAVESYVTKFPKVSRRWPT
jgi:hypothetical protein